MEKLISIIMGVYNGENVLDRGIESIKNQTYKNWEFIICDDASTDQSYELLKKYEKDSRFTILRNDKNSRTPITLNKCLGKAKGEYIAIMDCDDYSYPNRFEKQIRSLEENPSISFISSSMDIFDGEKIVSKKRNVEFPNKRDLVWNSPFVHPATIFKAEAIRSIGGYRVSKDTVRGQDYDLFMRLYGAGYKGMNLLDPVFRYTVDDNNLKRRTFNARIGEMKIRLYGYKKMGVLFWAFPFIFKPLIAYAVQRIRFGGRGKHE